jgi:hypothetical protein
MHSLNHTIDSTAQQLGIEAIDLQLWLAEHPSLTPYKQLQVLRMASKYQLDPLCNELGVVDTKEGSQAIITIDGWLKLINSHEQYAGMSFREPSDADQTIPAWMECTIYRHDRILPIIVKEYLAEVSTDHPSWQQMPRRMLRHRVIQQCARLAFGISQADVIGEKRMSHPEQVDELAVATKSLAPRVKQTENLKNVLGSHHSACVQDTLMK